jgi:hypothetical protein
MKPAADWTQLEHDYVTGNDDVTHASLAAVYGVARRTVSRHAGKENWLEKRRDFRHRIAAGAVQKAVNKIAKERAEQITVNRMSLQLAQRRLIEAIQERDADGNPVLKANSLDAATRAMVEVIRGIEFVEGEPDSRQEVNLNGSARDKLAERLEAFLSQKSSVGDDGGLD